MNSAHLVLIAVLIVVACEEDKKPPVPTTPTPNTTILFPGPSLSRLNVQGPAPTVGPRQMAAVKAVALFSDGSERDVTADARWTSTQPEIATVDAGVITGQALGRTLIRATYMSRSASLTMVIKPEGTFILTGDDYRAGTGQRWNGDSSRAEWPVAAASDGEQLWVL